MIDPLHHFIPENANFLLLKNIINLHNNSLLLLAQHNQLTQTGFKRCYFHPILQLN